MPLETAQGLHRGDVEGPQIFIGPPGRDPAPVGREPGRMNDVIVGLGEMEAPRAVRDLKDRQLAGPRRHTASNEELRAVGTEVDAHHPVGDQPRLIVSQATRAPSAASVTKRDSEREATDTRPPPPAA